MNDARAMIERNDESRNLMSLAAAQEDFVRRYAEYIPDDRRRDDFTRELMYLIHLTYREAQAPMVKHITQILAEYNRPLILERTNIR